MQFSADNSGRLWEHDGAHARWAGDPKWRVAAMPFWYETHHTITDAYMHRAQEQAIRIKELEARIAELEDQVRQT